MNRWLLFVFLWALLGTVPAEAITVARGSTVEIEEFSYSYYLDGSWWSLECRYRIDEGPWQTAFCQGTGGDRQLQLPGTSVLARADGNEIEWSFSYDVGVVRVGSRQLK